MWDWLWQSDSDLVAGIAAWVTLAAGLATLTLFCATLLLRYATIRQAARRRAVMVRWREILAASVLSGENARQAELPPRRRWAGRYLLEEWNRVRSLVEGTAAHNLIALGKRLRLDRMARELLHGRNLHDRLSAIQTLGHLGDAAEWSTLMALLGHPNTALSAAAAQSLVEIDPAAAAPHVLPEVIARQDWPPAAVHRILRAAGPGLVTQPLCHAILTGEPETAVRLLRFADLAQTERVEQLIEIVVRERREPAVLAAALKASDSQAGIPFISAFAGHEDWTVRVQAAKLLGRVGSERDLPVLERLLADPEWWVRYRAAQAIVQLPFMGPNALRGIRSRQADRYAAEMMDQAMAEVGLG